MNEADNSKARLLRESLNSYKEEYSELSETWRSLDEKSQGAIAVSGIFLAGILAFVRNLLEATTYVEKWLLTGSAAALAASIIFSLGVLWIRNVPKAPLGESFDLLVNDLLAAEGGMEERRVDNLFHDLSRIWKSTNQAVENANNHKARCLITAQVLLVAAIGFALVFTLLQVWGL